jgi:hypothetical protein
MWRPAKETKQTRIDPTETELRRIPELPQGLLITAI